MIKNLLAEMRHAKLDPSVGMKVVKLASGKSLTSFGIQMLSGAKVSYHSRSDGDEWYIILSGDGQVFLADENNGILTNHRTDFFSKGDVFCIPHRTVHQLIAHSPIEFILLSPDPHLEIDRIIFDDVF